MQRYSWKNAGLGLLLGMGILTSACIAAEIKQAPSANQAEVTPALPTAGIVGSLSAPLYPQTPVSTPRISELTPTPYSSDSGKKKLIVLKYDFDRGKLIPGCIDFVIGYPPNNFGKPDVKLFSSDGTLLNEYSRGDPTRVYDAKPEETVTRNLGLVVPYNPDAKYLAWYDSKGREALRVDISGKRTCSAEPSEQTPEYRR